MTESIELRGVEELVDQLALTSTSCDVTDLGELAKKHTQVDELTRLIDEVSHLDGAIEPVPFGQALKSLLDGIVLETYGDRRHQGARQQVLIRLPLTLAIIDGMIVDVGKSRFIIPTIVIDQTLRPESKLVFTVQNRGEMLRIRGELCPLLRLDALFCIRAERPPVWETMVVIIYVDGRRVGLVMDELIRQQQVLIKTSGEQFERVRGTSGAAILGGGRIGLVLEASGPLALHKGPPEAGRKGEFEDAKPSGPGCEGRQSPVTGQSADWRYEWRPGSSGDIAMKVLFVEDSRTIRNIQKSVPGRLGHTDIMEAGDEVEALQQVQKDRSDLALIECSVPNMDGITLVREIRARDKDLPLIMCTTEAERSRVLEAIRAGVNNYIVKPFTNETFTEEIQQTMDNAQAKATAPAARVAEVVP